MNNEVSWLYDWAREIYNYAEIARDNLGKKSYKAVNMDLNYIMGMADTIIKMTEPKKS